MAQLPQTDDPISIDIWSALEREREAQPGRSYLGMSSIGKACARRLFYDFRGYTPKAFEGRVLAIFEAGDDIEVRLKRYLTMAGYKVSGEQLGFEDFGGFFRGHCDGVIEGVTQQPHILECKSANDRQFSAFKQAGLRATWPEYYCQVQCYMGYSGLERALLIAQNKNTSDVHTERVHFSLQDFQGLRQRAWAIISAIDTPEPHYRDGSRECQWCSHEVICRRPAEHLQRQANCGTCIRFNCVGEGFDRSIGAHCSLHGPIPRDYWGQSGCPDWMLNVVPF